MGGSGGGGYYPPRTREEHDSEVEAAQQRTRENSYQSGVGDGIAETLSEYNNRDATTTRGRLDEIKAAIEDSIDGTVDIRFGGSVARHTYVDGLSDVDALILVNRTDAEDIDPAQLIDDFADQLRAKLGSDYDVDTGQLAVTVTHRDGEQIQLLPAVRTASGVRIADTSNGEWSKVVHPDRFARELTEANQNLNGRLIPSIKLLKPALSDLGMNGYHIEALAIRATRDMVGNHSEKSLVENILKYVAENVGHRVTDQTGQERFVDSYLGSPGSQARTRLERSARSILNNIETANQNMDAAAWMRELE